mmetsp:Transcript_86812/g.194404  ORF Transcript_86812/g.194404 Transcript_86812/m.194404 type:complete len:282 (+) Transcript_86812:54-899(+)
MATAPMDSSSILQSVATSSARAGDSPAGAGDVGFLSLGVSVDTIPGSWMSHAPTEVEKLGTGLVVIRGALPEETQLWLARYAMEVGAGEWYTKGVDGQKFLNCGRGTRGRCYKAVSDYPHSAAVTALCGHLVAIARSAVPKLPFQHLTHMLLLYYATAEGMEWHRDSDLNDGNNDEPIVSVSLGNASDFGYKPLFQAPKELTLASGDVLVWGGPQRMLEHCVLRTHLASGNPNMRSILGDARVNFTFRSAPNFLGHEEEFASAKFWVDPGTLPSSVATQHA